MPADTPESRRLAAIMFTDMVGFSAVSQRDEALAMELLDIQRRIVRAAVSRHQGREIKTGGDSFLLCFDSALQAVRCAVDIQEGLREHNQSTSPDRRILVRIGIHVGDVVERDGDILGDGVNIAARIEPIAPPGGILVTGPVHDQVHNKIPQRLRSLGRPELKNIEFPVDVYTVEIPGLGVGLPTRPRPSITPSSRIAGPLLVAAGTTVVALSAAGLLLYTLTRQPARMYPTPNKHIESAAKSLAVLPLQNLSGDPKQEFFADGVTDSLTTDLSHIRALRVISFQSAQRYKGKPLTDVARDLNVDYAVTGTVQRDKNQVIINAQLARAASQENLWGQRYEGDARDVLNTQNTIVLAISKAVKAELTPKEKELFTVARPVNPEAQSHYFLGRAEYGKGDEASLHAAIKEYEKAVTLDGRFAAAYAGIADCYNSLSSFYIPPREAMPKAEAAAMRALALDGNLGKPIPPLATSTFSISGTGRRARPN